jgi:hypothetical protein
VACSVNRQLNFAECGIDNETSAGLEGEVLLFIF